MMPWWINRTGGDVAKYYRKLARERAAEALTVPRKARGLMDEAKNFTERARKECGRMEVECRMKATEVMGREIGVLKRVKKKVPEEAKGAIENAIKRQKAAHERFVEKMEERIQKARKEMPEMPVKARKQVKRQVENISKRLKKEKKLLPKPPEGHERPHGKPVMG